MFAFFRVIFNIWISISDIFQLIAAFILVDGTVICSSLGEDALRLPPEFSETTQVAFDGFFILWGNSVPITPLIHFLPLTAEETARFHLIGARGVAKVRSCQCAELRKAFSTCLLLFWMLQFI